MFGTQYTEIMWNTKNDWFGHFTYCYTTLGQLISILQRFGHCQTSILRSSAVSSPIHCWPSLVNASADCLHLHWTPFPLFFRICLYNGFHSPQDPVNATSAFSCCRPRKSFPSQYVKVENNIPRKVTVCLVWEINTSLTNSSFFLNVIFYFDYGVCSNMCSYWWFDGSYVILVMVTQCILSSDACIFLAQINALLLSYFLKL